MGDERNYDIVEIAKTVEVHTEQISEVKKDIRDVKENQLKYDLRMAEMQKAQSDTQLLIINTSIENHKSTEKMMEKMVTTMLTTLTSSFRENNKTNNKIKLTDRKEFWAIASAIITAIIAYLKLAQ